MDANRSTRTRAFGRPLLTLSLLVPALGGCAQLFQRPQATQPRSQPADAEVVKQAPARPMNAVEPAASQPRSDVDSQVQEWLAGIPENENPDAAERPLASRFPVDPGAQSNSRDDVAAEQRLPTEDDAALISSQEPAPNPGVASDDVRENSSAPPVLTGVSVRPAAHDPRRSTPDEPTTANAARTSASAVPSMDELLRLHAAQLADVGFREQLDRRMLLVLAGDLESARQPLDAVSDEQQRIAAQFIESLIAMREIRGGDPQAEVDKLRSQVSRLHETLRSTSDPAISTLALCRSVRGFGLYELFDPPLVMAGSDTEFIAYIEVRDFAAEELPSGEFESRFALRTSVLNRGGETLLDMTDDSVVDRCRSRRRDCFIPRLVRIPASLSPGEYVVKVSLTDKIAQRVTEQRTTFRVVVRP